ATMIARAGPARGGGAPADRGKGWSQSTKRHSIHPAWASTIFYNRCIHATIGQASAPMVAALQCGQVITDSVAIRLLFILRPTKCRKSRLRYRPRHPIGHRAIRADSVGHSIREHDFCPVDGCRPEQSVAPID